MNLNEMGTTGRDKFSVTKACKNPELLLKWVDQMYDPIISMQAIYGPIAPTGRKNRMKTAVIP